MSKKTLHLCNNESIKKLDIYIDLISNNDAVVFYVEKINPTLYKTLTKAISKNPIYFIINENYHNLKTITNDQLLNLVNQYEKTFTWK